MQEFYDNEDGRRLLKVATFAVTILGIFLLFTSLKAFKDWRTPSLAINTISMSGEGEAYATPDIATFSFSVSADAKAVSDAQTSVTTKIDKVVAALKNLGIDEKDIQTTDYSVYPKYTYVGTACPLNSSYCPPGRQVADGYTVTHSITVKVRKTDDAGKALGVVGTNGGTNISSLDFTVDDPNAIQAEARDKAVQDAKTKADALAKSLDVDLGRVVNFDENGSNQGPYPVYAMDSMAGGATKAAAPSLPVGQNKVVSNVTITYEIR